MQKRCGGKFSGNHTTLTELAATLSDIAAKIPSVRKISPGFIQIIPGGRGERRVKFVDKNSSLLMRISQSCSVQEVLVITDDLQATKLALARAARNMNVHISFQRPS